MLQFRNAQTKQGDFELAADLQFSAPVTALLGPSGAGKSTLLNMIAGFVPLTAGEILWSGQVISDLKPAERPVSFIFQDNNLFPHLTVTDNLALALTKSTPTVQEAAEITDALKRVDLADFDNRKPSELSGGQQARVALARVLLQKRPLMLLDEAFASLGPALKRDMLGLVQQVSLEENMQVIMISHDPNDALLIADEGAAVFDGTVTQPKDIKTLLTNPPSQLADYL